MAASSTDSAVATPVAGNHHQVAISEPSVSDAGSMWRLVRDEPNLELNTGYAYLLVCSHFRDTSVVAKAGEELAGFVAGYRPPRASGALFVWQIGVAPEHRGEGLGLRLLLHLVERGREQGVRFLESTVTASNEPSQRLFHSVARELDVPCEESPLFTPDLFPGEGHETETLFRIGPFSTDPHITHSR